jgi:dTDP-glucose 4,6-dehydratase
MQNILVTGCAGFIGSHFVETCLKNGHKVVGVDCMTYAGKYSNMASFIDKIKFYKENICNFQKMVDIVQRNNVEIIFNFAAETHVDNSILSSEEFISSNIIGVKSLLEACRSTGTKLIQISTDEVYGSTKSGSFDELSRLNPRNPYSATKAAAEHLVTAYSETHGVNFKLVRMSNNFGPRQDSEKFLPTIIRSIRDKKKIPVYGDGSNIRDWLYVKDGSALIYTVFKKGKYGNAYNVTYNNEMTNIELIKKVTDAMNVDFDSCIQFVKDRPGHDFRYSINNEKLRSLGIQPATKFKHCLIETINERG